MAFFKKVDTCSRKAMVDFLSGHFRYNTMNGWNNATSYAHNMKIYNLPFTKEERSRLYDMFDLPIAWEMINDLIMNWNVDHKWGFQAYFNGRSGGYLVFCEGGLEDKRVYSQPGKGVDMDEDFSEWGTSDLRDRVKLVQEFDKLADDIVEEAKYLANNYEVAEETVMVQKQVRVLKERAA